MNRWPTFLLLLLLLPAAAGCGRGALALGSGMLLGAAIVASQEPPREEVVVYQSAPPVYVVTAPPRPVAPPPPAPPPAPVFDAAAAREALEQVDLDACRSAGAPLGYGHARVTFMPDGNVSRVTIDSPAGLSASAVSCIGAGLGASTVPRFEGSPVAFPTPYEVR